VIVPSEAKVFVNDRATRSTGERRQYLSNGLKQDRSYKYEVRAELDVDGQIVKRTRVVDLHAGDSSELAFDFASEQEVETRLTLNVPDDAKVTLAGSETSFTGPTRVFSTTSLSAGQQWTDYTVQVTVEREGRMLSKEQTITLEAGASRELSFEFEDDKIAAAN
jgi:uncharacterized protein (TIGR03000 family)